MKFGRKLKYKVTPTRQLLINAIYDHFWRSFLMVKLDNKDQYINKLFSYTEKKTVRDRTTIEKTYYFIYDIIEGKVEKTSIYSREKKEEEYQLYGIKALEVSFKNDRSNIHFTNCSANYRKWRPAFFTKLKEEKDEYEIFKHSMEGIIEELFSNKKDIDFFVEKYRVNNLK